MTPIFRLLVMAITFTAAAATHHSRGPECAQVTQTLATSLCQVSDLCHVNHRAECFPESSSHWDPYLNGVSPDDSQLGVALRCAPCDAGIQSTSNAPSDVYEICPVSLGRQSQAVLIRAKRTQQQTGLVDSNLNHNFVMHEYHPFCSQFLPCSSLRTGERLHSSHSNAAGFTHVQASMRSNLLHTSVRYTVDHVGYEYPIGDDPGAVLGCHLTASCTPIEPGSGGSFAPKDSQQFEVIAGTSDSCGYHLGHCTSDVGLVTDGRMTKNSQQLPSPIRWSDSYTSPFSCGNQFCPMYVEPESCSSIAFVSHVSQTYGRVIPAIRSSSHLQFAGQCQQIFPPFSQYKLRHHRNHGQFQVEAPAAVPCQSQVHQVPIAAFAKLSGRAVHHNRQPPAPAGINFDTDVCSIMQQPTMQDLAIELDEQTSEASVIPEDWILELQRLAQRLEAQCQLNYPEELLFTVYTWYLDHPSSYICNDPKLATLGGHPNEWEEDLIFPWRHRVRPGDKIFIDVVFPYYSRISQDQHIAHVILTQRATDRVSTLLEVDFSRVYGRPWLARRALALPAITTIEDIKPLAPHVAEHAEAIRWIYRPTSPQGSFHARNGMTIKIEVLDTFLSPREAVPEGFSLRQLQASNVQEPSLQDDNILMQLQSLNFPSSVLSVSSDSSIPDDWYLDLQRMVSYLEQQCQGEYPEEVFFMVTTGYIDHQVGRVATEAKVAHLGGYPPDWEGDIKYPWRNHIIQFEHVHLDLVFPPIPGPVMHEPIAHIILTQRRFQLISILLVVELRYTRPMVFRSALAVPSPCSCDEVFSLSLIAQEYRDSLTLIQPPGASCVQPFVVRDGMTILLRADFPEQDSQPHEADISFLTQIGIDVHHAPHVPIEEGHADCQSSGTTVTPQDSSQVPQCTPHAHGVDLPPASPETQHYAFNIHAAEFIPGVPPIQAQTETIQDLYDAWSQVAFTWQEGTLRNIAVETWFVDHRALYPMCIASRQVLLDHQYHLWEQRIKDRWVDQLDPTQVAELFLVSPHPPRLEVGIAAHLILVQSPRDEWISSLISVDDPVLNRMNDDRLMRLVLTTDEHFTIEQIVQSCGYPITCTSVPQALRCFAWVQCVGAGPTTPSRSALAREIRNQCFP